MLHAKDPLFWRGGGGTTQEAMGLLMEVGGYFRGHVSPDGAGGRGAR